MKFYVVSVLIILGAMAAALNAAEAAPKRTTFTCKAKDAVFGESKKPITVMFQVDDLESKDPQIVYQPENDNGEEPTVIVTPDPYAVDLDSNQRFTVDKKGLEIWADGAGCVYYTLFLYRESGFKRGYLREEGTTNCGTPNNYSTVSCKLATK